MKALIEYSGDWMNKKTRIEDIDSLEQLLELHKKEKNPLIITKQVKQWKNIKADFSIEVYDTYRE